MNWWIRKFKSSGSEEQTVREGWFQVSIRNVLLLAKAKETPHHVWLYDHTSLFKLTIETKMSFKVKMSKTLSNIHTTKSYQTKKKKKKLLQTYSHQSTPTEHVLLKGRGWGGIVQTHQQYQKKVTEKRDSEAESHYLQNKTRVSNLLIPHPLHRNGELLQHRIVSTFYHNNRVSACQYNVYLINGPCQHFTIATKHKHFIMATWFYHNFTIATENVKTLPQQQSNKITLW